MNTSFNDCWTFVVAIVAVVTIAVGPASANFKTIDFSSSHNWRMQDFPPTNAQYFPEGDVVLGGVPFSIPTEGNNVWLATHYTDACDVLEIIVNEYGVDGVHTLINTSGGVTGGPYAWLEFFGTNGAYYRKDLYGDDDIRDYYYNWYTNSINGTTTTNVFTYGSGYQNEVRLDKQWINLPAMFDTETLTTIRLTDKQNTPSQDPFLAGLTVEYVAEPATIYVDADANGANDGTSWADAFNYLQDALVIATNGDEIWVAEGVYTPDQGGGNTAGDRKATFQLKDGVAIYGGYAGFGEPIPDARDVSMYETILSGDLNGDNGPDFGNNLENSYHVVTAIDSDSDTILDGLTITAGNANGSPGPDWHGGGMFMNGGSPAVINCTFSASSGIYGGGMASWYSSPTVTNCTFSGNFASQGGGGVANDSNSSPTLANCIFSGNRAGRHGGGLANGHSNPTLTNCTFAGNKAGRQGGGINNWEGTATVTNCILWDNTAPMGAQIYNDWAGSATVRYSDIQRGWPGEGNIDEDPCFVNPNGPDGISGTEDDNLRLLPFSLCIDAGNSTAIPIDTMDLDGDGNTTERIPLDLDMNPRFVDVPPPGGTGVNDPPDYNEIVDMGAYEAPLANPVELLVELAQDVIALNLQQGISNSLDAKLEAAMQALDDINENNDVAAINTLQAFINAVEAQRGNKISEADADTLIASAQEIIDVLSIE